MSSRSRTATSPLRDLALHVGKGSTTVADECLRFRYEESPDLLARMASRGEMDYAEVLATVHDIIDGRRTVAEARAVLVPDVLSSLARLMAGLMTPVQDFRDAADISQAVRMIRGPIRLSRDAPRIDGQANLTLGRYDYVARILDDELDDDTRWILRAELEHPANGRPGASEAVWLEAFNQRFVDLGLLPVTLRDGPEAAFDRLAVDVPDHLVVDDPDAPVVTVVMSTFKPDRSFPTAVASLSAQTWRNLEIMVVDDCSPPEFDDLLGSVAATDPRITLLRMPENGGTYKIRNRAIAECRGEFVTFQDSDDWAHPERIARQVTPLIDAPSLVASHSRSLRVHDDLTTLKVGYNSFRRAAASLMFRKDVVIEALGAFDETRKAADTEFGDRIDTVFGAEANVNLPDVLVLTQLTEGSLSREEFAFGWHHPVRVAYNQAARHWHREIAAGREQPVLEPGGPRRFPAPSRFLTGKDAPPVDCDVMWMSDWRGDLGRYVGSSTVVEAISDAGLSKKLRHILVRHEQGAGHAAEGYALATGRVGVCMATSGPGATNLVTPIADAYMDSVPIVAITGQVPSAAIGTDAFQEADIVGITMPITKHNYLVQRAEDIPRIIAEAFHLALSGRPGPVLVDIPKDILQTTTGFSWPPTMELPGYHPTTKPHSKQIREAAKLLLESKRPVLYVGGGVIKAGASAELRALAELTGAPVVTTLMARGAFPDSHPQHLGMPGMHGSVSAVTALQRSDLIVALGARFDDRVTGKLSSFAPGASVIHVDIDPAEISKNRTADVPIVGDARESIAEIVTAVQVEHAAGKRADIEGWWVQLNQWREAYPLGYDPAPDGALSPQYAIERLGAIAGPDALYVAGVGQHQMWASQFVKYEKPGTWLNSGGLGTMGFAVPAAMGAKVGRPEATVWAIDGDGCFQMTNQELATCAIEGIPIKVAVINNGNLGMVRQWQTLFYDKRYSNTDLQSSRIPDFVKLADAYGCIGLRCEKPDDVDSMIEKAMSINDAPVVLEFVVHPDAQVWPMVPAGTSNDLIQFAQDVRPDFDPEEMV